VAGLSPLISTGNARLCQIAATIISRRSKDSNIENLWYSRLNRFDLFLAIPSVPYNPGQLEDRLRSSAYISLTELPGKVRFLAMQLGKLVKSEDSIELFSSQNQFFEPIGIRRIILPGMSKVWSITILSEFSKMSRKVCCVVG
jgi:hypothetical protein